VRVVALPAPVVHRTVGLLRPASHAKASLADALLVELGALAKPAAHSRKRSKRLKT
jgi:hypothetical protein